MGGLNLELFKKIRDRIAAIPESYDQSRWLMHRKSSPCGYAACLAGEAIICNAPTVAEGIAELRKLFAADDEMLVPNRAGELLGLEGCYEDWGTEHDIFASAAYAWPKPFRTQFQDDETSAAVLYLDWIIANDRIFPEGEEAR